MPFSHHTSLVDTWHVLRISLVDTWQVLHEMPFSSELKRMGIVLRHAPSGEVLFYVKGADSVMVDRLTGADWVEEEVGNLAREGLRTLVVACRALTPAQYASFAAELSKARLAKTGRHAAVRPASKEMGSLIPTAIPRHPLASPASSRLLTPSHRCARRLR